MFELDKSTIDYMKDLSDPEMKSSSDMESINLKRQIIGINLLTGILGVFVIGTIIILTMFFLPGLFNVSLQIFWYYVATVLSYWQLLLIGFVLLVVLAYFSYRHS